LRKTSFLILACFCFAISGKAQFAVPYFQNFDSLSAPMGWSHGAFYGQDSWMIGAPPAYYSLRPAPSSPNAAGTMAATMQLNSSIYLQTPAFNLSDTTVKYALAFSQKRNMQNYDYGYVTYSLDTGRTWTNFFNNSNLNSKNWYNNTSAYSNNSFTGNYPFTMTSARSLALIQGHKHVLFRFVYITGNSLDDGWLVDDFSIIPESYNITATRGDTVKHLAVFMPTFTIKTPLLLSAPYNAPVYDTTAFYLSRDTILDPGDSLLGRHAVDASQVSGYWSNTFNTPAHLDTGFHYVIFVHDYHNRIKESNENDNTSFAVLHVDTTFAMPYRENFEGPHLVNWKTYLNPNDQPCVWSLGMGYGPHIENAHSGTHAWHTSLVNSYKPVVHDHYVESPFMDLAGCNNPVLAFWFKEDSLSYHYPQYSADGGITWYPMAAAIAPVDDWSYYQSKLPAAAVSCRFLKIRFDWSNFSTNSGQFSFDDVYVGSALPDLSIEKDLTNRYSLASNTTDTLRYDLTNSGRAPAPTSITSFYWSTDTLLGPSDIYLGSQTEALMNDTSSRWEKFIYTKPANVAGTYYIFYVIDTSHAVNEMREYNNTGYFTLYNEKLVSLPYFNDFEVQADGWRHNGSIRSTDDWQWGNPTGTHLSKAFSGTKAWITNAHGPVVSWHSRSHLYSPVFDFSNSISPVIEFDLLNDAFNPYNNLSGGNISYSNDGGLNWTVLDTASMSFKEWYVDATYDDYGGIDKFTFANPNTLLSSGSEKQFRNSFADYQTRDSKRTTRFITDLRHLAGQKHVQFRFNFANSTANCEGMMLDNFTLREKFIDLSLSYKQNLMISSSAQNIRFYMEVENNGNYISSPSVSQYYLSADTLLDASDVLIGIRKQPAIRPDMTDLVNVAFPSPASLASYHYLIYKLDATNTNTESNEANNTGWWPLGTDTITPLPYFNDFSADHIHGWTWYLDSGIVYSGYRFRHKAILQDNVNTTGNEWFLDRINNTFSSESHYPTMYLESPLFNFSNYDSLSMSFDFLCVGNGGSNNSSGGTMQYSLDGGNSWSVLGFVGSLNSTNWYDWQNVHSIGGDGWTNYRFNVPTHAQILFSQLANQPKVKFRIKFKSDYYQGSPAINGFHLDNFRIDAGHSHIDYIAKNTFTPFTANVITSPIQIPYTILNAGPDNGVATRTAFFWSTDSIFTNADPLVWTATESPILHDSSYQGLAPVNYPTPIVQHYYYVFYVVNSDKSFTEASRNNNVGSIKIYFPVLGIDYVAQNHFTPVNASVTVPTIQLPYVIYNAGSEMGLPSNTRFYWSTDSTLSQSDSLVLTIAEPVIYSGSLNSSSPAVITYPTPLLHAHYFVFYKADADSAFNEISEGNNVGSFRINFANLGVESLALQNSALKAYYTEGEVQINFNSPHSESGSAVTLMNCLGQVIATSPVNLHEGSNAFRLPASNLATGLYLIRLQVGSEIFSQKIYVY
jgi:hypothetical protein